jgi:UDP-GlcNAc3NAcA epimerase
MRKIITVIGARPQFIKAAIVSKAMEKRGITELILHTGQHFDSNMSDVFFDELGIPKPAFNLGIGGGSHGQNTGRMIEGIEKVLIEEKPDWLLVYGDTDSTLAGALAAVKLHIPVAHVEAGLRSFNRRMPEEINRILTDHAATRLFAATETSVMNLANEGISADKVMNVGDVMYDAALFYGAKADQQSRILEELRIGSKEYILATVHRAENTDVPERLKAIVQGMADSGRQIVLPVHPRTKARMQASGLTLPENVIAIDPVGYLDMVMLEKHAALIMTDSGGVQKEAFFYHVPCITLRDETEWVELVEAGWNQIVPPVSAAAIVEAIALARKAGKLLQPYGDGKAAERVADNLNGL